MKIPVLRNQTLNENLWELGFGGIAARLKEGSIAEILC